jgi:hypothetical protein
MASVKWRISKLIADHPAQAAPLHVRQLNRFAGTNLTVADAMAIYKNIDPYITFEQQRNLWFNPAVSTDELTMIAASIRNAVASNVLPKGAATPRDITIADIVYNRALQLKGQATRLMATVQQGMSHASSAKSVAARKLLGSARTYFAIYDYLDAVNFARAAKAALQ